MHQPGYGPPGYGHQPAPQGPPGFGPPPAYGPYAQNPSHPPSPSGPQYPQYPSSQPPAPPTPPAPAGPDFLAADRLNSVVVDATGVAFEMLGRTSEFPWQVIRSVHYRPGPNGKVLMVAVVHIDGRMFECVVDARRRETLREWCAQLGAVLGHYRPMV